jgi:hypothetical protein
MERDERKIIKEQGNKGVMIFRYSDFNEEIDKDDIDPDSELGWRLSIIMEKFKLFLDLFPGDGGDVSLGVVLGAVIKDAEREIDDISKFIDKSLGGIGILYKYDRRYGNFEDRAVAGLVFRPSSRQSSR